MEKKFKFVIIGIIGVFLFSSLILYSLGIFTLIPGTENDDDLKNKEVNEPQSFVENITLIVDYGDGNIDIWEDFNLTEDTTAFDALNEWCDVDYNDLGWGVFVTGINRVENEDPNYWFYGVNNEYASVGSSKYNLADGDTVNWVYGTSYHPS